MLELLGEETAVSSPSSAVVGNLSSLELHAPGRAVAEHGSDGVDDGGDKTGLHVDKVLLRSVSSAKRSIEGTGERVLAEAVLGLVVELLVAVLGVLPARRGGRCLILLLVTVGANDDNLEVIAGLASVDGGLLVDTRAENAALVLGDGRGVLARALVRVPGGVTLDVDVETLAQLGLVAVSSAPSDIVALEDLVGEVRVGVHGGIKILEGLLVSGGGLSLLGHIVVDLVLLEGIGGVGSGGRAIGSWLRSARVKRVDESAVSADLDSRGAGWVTGESPGVGPIDRCAGRRNDVGGGDGRRGYDGSRGLGHGRLVGGRLDVVARSSIVAWLRWVCRLRGLVLAEHGKEKA